MHHNITEKIPAKPNTKFIADTTIIPNGTCRRFPLEIVILGRLQLEDLTENSRYTLGFD
jgi:hypothetical protein